MRCRHKLFDRSGSSVSSRQLLNYPEEPDMLGCLERSSPAQGNNGPVVVLLSTFTAAGFCCRGSCWGKWFHLGSDLTGAPLWGPPISDTETGPLLLPIILSFCFHCSSPSFILTIADLLCGINTLKVDLMIVYILQNVAERLPAAAAASLALFEALRETVLMDVLDCDRRRMVSAALCYRGHNSLSLSLSLTGIWFLLLVLTCCLRTVSL